MNSISFYHINKTDTYLALCRLVEKALYADYKILIRTSSEEVTDEIDEILWSYDQSSFLPHSKSIDQNNEEHPIFISDQTENPTNATCLFVVSTPRFSIPEICKFQRTFILFNNQDKEFMNTARKLWSEIANFNLKRKYWVEENKGWVLKKEA